MIKLFDIFIRKEDEIMFKIGLSIMTITPLIIAFLVMIKKIMEQ